MGKGNDPNCGRATTALAATPACPSAWALPEAVRDPEFTLPGVTVAARHLADVLNGGGRVAVFCDYDPDGTFSGELIRRAVSDTFKTSFDLDDHAPVTFSYASARDSFGLQPQWVRDVAQAGVKAIVTLDCGSKSTEAVALAQQLGVTVTVCDHHDVDRGLVADHHLNPRLHREGAESGSVCALKLAWALDMQLSGADKPSDTLLTDGLWLAAFGARADLCDMDDAENAALLQAGREHTKINGYPPGLMELCDQIRRHNPERDHKTVSAVLNVPKRTPLASARDVGQLLAATSREQARDAAARLVDVRERSRAALTKLTEDAVSRITAQRDAEPHRRMLFTLMDSDDTRVWSGHAGMAANTAAQIADTPVLIGMMLDGGDVKWSARLAFRGSHSHRSMLLAMPQLQQASVKSDGQVSVGGHPGAVSGRCRADRFDQVAAVFERWAQQQPDWPQPAAS